MIVFLLPLEGSDWRRRSVECSRSASCCTSRNVQCGKIARHDAVSCSVSPPVVEKKAIIGPLLTSQKKPVFKSENDKKITRDRA
jgi:hypothetical protein